MILQYVVVISHGDFEAVGGVVAEVGAEVGCFVVDDVPAVVPAEDDVDEADEEAVEAVGGEVADSVGVVSYEGVIGLGEAVGELTKIEGGIGRARLLVGRAVV